MNYTKGEWKAYQTEKVPERWSICAGLEGNQGICKTLLDTSIPPGEKRANAHLISAAPEMYEALKALIDESRGTDRFGLDIITDAISALAKVEGK